MKKTATPLLRSAAAPAVTHAAPQADRRLATAQQQHLQQAIDTSLRQVAQRQQAVALPAAPNRTGLPDALKAGVEHLSGHALDDVRVHYNSARPAQLQAHAFAQGSDIHLAPGQEKHLPHEAWHVVQQKQGRVPATTQLKGVGINDNQQLEKEADAAGQLALRALPATQAARIPAHQAASPVAAVAQRKLVDDITKVEEAKNKMLESRAPLTEQFTNYSKFIKEYRPAKDDSTFREKSALGLYHWAEHFNVGAQGSLSELRRVRGQIGYDPNNTFAGATHPDPHRKIRFGINNSDEPDLVSASKGPSPVNANQTLKQRRAEEIKGVSTASETNVGANLNKALKQLDKPRADGFDYWKAVIYITNANNPWPYLTIAAASGASSTDIQQEAENRVNSMKPNSKARNKYEIDVNGINQYDVNGQLVGAPGRIATKVIWNKSEKQKQKRAKTTSGTALGNTKKSTTHNYPPTPSHHSDYH